MDTNSKQQTGSTETVKRSPFVDLKNWGARLVAEIEGEPARPVRSLTDTQLIMKALANSHQLSMWDDVRRELRRRSDEVVNGMTKDEFDTVGWTCGMTGRYHADGKVYPIASCDFGEHLVGLKGQMQSDPDVITWVRCENVTLVNQGVTVANHPPATCNS